ncbi:hypothetical protein ACFY3G_45185 [Streptomyces phaeochromogenes]|uniref:hypothetical protein n=1 Tax=Streptomyces phaeochromogenes TaxID=1923 RepID=UPI0036936A36
MIGAPEHIALLSLPVLRLMRVAYWLRGATRVQWAWVGLKGPACHSRYVGRR